MLELGTFGVAFGFVTVLSNKFFTFDFFGAEYGDGQTVVRLFA